MRASLVRRVLSQNAAIAKSNGIFGNDKLKCPADFDRVTDTVIEQSEHLVNEILQPYQKRKTRKTSVKLLDDLSNTICTTADLAECVRNMHPDNAYRAVGNNSIYRLTNLLETLNSMPALYHSVDRSVESEASMLDDVDKRTLRLFLDDFEQCGVHLKDSQRAEFIRLSNKIFELGVKFCEQTDRYDDYTKYDAGKEKALIELMSHRQQLARLTGYKSYADRAQQHMILSGYEKAEEFLDLVGTSLKPLVEEELEDAYRISKDNKLITSKAELSRNTVEVASKIEQRKLYLQYGDVSRFFGFGRVLKGFGDLCSDLYGIRLKVSKSDPHEIWEGPVVKLECHKGDQFLGTIYIDAESRRNKSDGDCHYTVKCSKTMDDGSHQKPIVVLSLSFFTVKNRNMELNELLDSVTINLLHAENLFHELGHAIHSMLGATRYQHTAGTRCPTDFAEVPSNLMEFFFSDARVLKRFCMDPRGTLFSDEHAKALHSALNMYPAYFSTLQLLLARFDLQLHHSDGESPMSLYHKLHREVLPNMAIPADYAYHQNFTHLVTYGAKYYSYTIAKACASQIWQKHFEQDPFSRVSGEHWASVQARGGELPSAKLLELALGTKLSVEDLAEAFKLHCIELRDAKL